MSLNWAIQKECRRLFLQHVRRIEEAFPDEDFEDISEYEESDFEEEARANVVARKPRARFRQFAKGKHFPVLKGGYFRQTKNL